MKLCQSLSNSFLRPKEAYHKLWSLFQRYLDQKCNFWRYFRRRHDFEMIMQ